MKKYWVVLVFCVLILFIKAQNWVPLDTGYFDPNFHSVGLCADTANGNIFQTNGAIENVFHNGKWEFWYPNILQDNSLHPIICYKNKKNLFFKFFYENNNNAKPRTALLRFSNATDLDTILVMAGDWTNSDYTYLNNNLILTLGSVGGHTITYNSIAEFDGASFTAIGKPSWGVTEGYVQRCVVYNGELFAAGDIDSSIAVLKSGGWKTVYPGIHGGSKSISKLLVYNNRLYVIGGFWQSENSGNPGNGIAAWDGTKWDNLGGGAFNEFIGLNGAFDDAVVCNNKLYLVGNFTHVSGMNAKRLVSWNDTTWCTICKDINDCNGRLWTIECLRDTIYCYGSFPMQNNKNIGGIGKLLNMNFSDTCSAPIYAGIKTYSDLISIKIYPNPASNKLHISTDMRIDSAVEITIFNNLGQTVLKFPYRNEVDISDFQNGLYLLKISAPDKREFYSKFIKQ